MTSKETPGGNRIQVKNIIALLRVICWAIIFLTR
jgi:hypothetical protein